MDYIIPTEKTALSFLISCNKKALHSHVVSQIYDAMISGDDVACLFKFDDGKHFVTLIKEDWILTLNYFFPYLLENELYESCALVKTCLEILNEKNDISKEAS